MAAEMRHVRFTLTELIQAVQATCGEAQAPSADEALTWYWNWATNRGWSLRMIANQINSAALATRIERGDQMEWAPEEHWNVVWCGEDTDGGPDLVAEVGAPLLTEPARMIVHELLRRGWVMRSPGGPPALFNREGDGAILLADVLAEADAYGSAGVAANLEDIASRLEA
jgi:hypothetical protein